MSSPLLFHKYATSNAGGPAGTLDIDNKSTPQATRGAQPINACMRRVAWLDLQS